MDLTADETALLAPDVPDARAAEAMAMRILVGQARAMGAGSLVPITHAHIDSCVFFAEAGVLYAERLVALGGRVKVPSSLNVGALDLVREDAIHAPAAVRALSRRLMEAYLALGCQATWTCAPYQAGQRPGLGEQVVWAESNAIVFANSVLGARTNRYGDLIDICAALTARAPYSGLHVTENRRARVLVDLGALPPALMAEESFCPVLGAWLGRAVGETVPALLGLPADLSEDRLKALGAAAASTGAVALYHAIGITPEAPDLATAFQGREPEAVLRPALADLRAARASLTVAEGEAIDCVALGSPHFSAEECRELARLAAGQRFAVPVHICTRFDVWKELGAARAAIEAAGGEFLLGTCVAVAPALRSKSGVMMTNSAKFAHYAQATTGHEPAFGSLADCVASAVAGRITREEGAWAIAS